ncbi:glycosyltransferase [Uliginosibacterium sp. sgz301328]|uniref:glycosyltransferase n=1 Tax=Uliginosibacterium sp. sgz301328 TaxID=3243764 RepID=UPI00359DB6F0
MLKVLIVAGSYPYPEHRDGLAKINANLLVTNSSFRADMLCVQDVDYPEPPMSAFYKMPALPALSRAAQAGAYLFSSMPIGLVRLAPYFDSFSRFIINNHHRYDVIHLSSAYMAGLVRHLPPEVIAKTILFPIDSVSLFWARRRDAEQGFLKRQLYGEELLRNRRLERELYPLFRKAVFVSDVDARHAQKLAPRAHCTSIPNGVDIAYFHPMSVQRTASIVFTGDMSYAPNRDAAYFLLDEILPRIPPELAPHVYLVGQRPCKRLQSLNMKGLTVTGFVDDLRPYLAEAAAYVSPLRFGSGIKNKVLEAMAMGQVVVGTPVSFEGIACKSGKHCISTTTTPDDFAAALTEVLRDRAAFEPMGAQARALVEQEYSWDSIRKAYGKLYESCAAHR